MSQSSPEEEETLISLSDFSRLIYKARKQIAIGSLVCAFIGGSYTLTRASVYEAEGSFREKEHGRSGVDSFSIGSFLLHGPSPSANYEAVTTMHSRFILEKLIRSQGLQGTIQKKGDKKSLLGTIKDNLVVEYYHLLKKKTPSLKDPQPSLSLNEIYYDGEVPISYEILFHSDGEYTIVGLNETGVVNKPITTQDATFTITKNKEDPLKNTRHTVTISPLSYLATELRNSIEIETDKEDKNLLTLKTLHPDRHTAAKMLNQLMFLYQDHLYVQQERIARLQLDYLIDREAKISEKLLKKLENYAENISSYFSSNGFTNIEKAMEFLANIQQRYQEKLFTIDLAINRQKSVLDFGVAYIPIDSEEKSNNIINHILTNIRQLQQQKDSIQLALHNSPSSSPEIVQNTFEKQIQELDEVHQCCEEAEELLASLEENRPLPQSESLLENPKYMARIWAEKLVEGQVNWENASSTERKSLKNEWIHNRDSFIAYLSNLIHYFHVYEKTLKENLTHQQKTVSEFQGINLDTAQELYITHSKQLSETESETAQKAFLLTQIQDPDFELTSLSSSIKDPVIEKTIGLAGNLILRLKDEQNRSEKEQTRIKNELAIHKRFIEQHLKQTHQLLTLRQGILKSKIDSLLGTMLGLVQQQTSILEEHLSDTIENQIQNLEQEKEIISQHKESLQLEMAKLPKEWIEEKLINQQLKMNEHMMEEITKLVESKNIAHHLEVIQSAPVDFAIPNIHPRSPRLFLFMILGAILGAFLSSITILSRAILQGIPVSKENLVLKNAHVSGYLTGDSTETLSDEDLSTLRRLATFIKKCEVKSILMIETETIKASIKMAKLFHMEGKKVLILPISFDKVASENELPGLLQILQEKIDDPKINQNGDYDWISQGGISRFSNELLGNPRFDQLLRRLEKDYDLIIAVSHASPCSAEGESQLSHFQHAAICVNDEKLHNLHFYTNENQNKKITFLLEQ